MFKKIDILTPEELFVSKSLKIDLLHKSVRGGGLAIASQLIRFVFQLGSMMVLSRLLSPEDFGLIGMVTVFVYFASMFKDAGLSTATIQQDDITHEQISALFWVNVAISVILGICVLASAPLVAWFYNKPVLLYITAILSSTLFISGLTIQHLALLKRHLHIKSLTLIDICSLVMSTCVAVIFSYFGWKYWSLVLGALTQSIVQLVLTFLLCPWMPGKFKRGVGIKRMLCFGGHVAGFDFLNYFARNGDNVIIGKFLGADALGIYSRAYQILMLPITLMSGPLGGVAVPVLSRLSNDIDRMNKYYLEILFFLSFFGGLIAGISYILSNEIVLIILGEKWIQVADVFKYLAIGALFQPIYHTQSWLHVAVGKSNRVFIWGLFGTPIIIISFLIGILWGANGVALAYSIVICILTLLSLYYAGCSANLSYFKIINSFLRQIVSCISSVAILDYCFSNIVIENLYLNVLIVFLLYLFFYLAIIIGLHLSFKPIYRIINILKIFIIK